MSHLFPGDDDMHHENSSHRWTGGPPPDDPKAASWEARLRAHMAAHRERDLGLTEEPD